MTTIWDELGIAPTNDPQVIRRAYAARLKTTRPEEKPDDFQRLRSAYSAALRIAEGAGNSIATESKDPPAELQMEDASKQTLQSTFVKPATERQLAIETLNAAFGSGNGETAVTAMRAATTGNLLTIDMETAFSGKLIQILLTDKTIPPARMFEIAQQFGWYGVADSLRGPNGQLERRLCARIDAGLWLNALKREASDWRYWIGQSGAGAARLLLGFEPAALAWVSLPAQLPKRLAEAMLHAPLLGSAIEVGRIEMLRQLLARRRKLSYLPIAINLAVMALLLVISSLAGVRALAGMFAIIIVEIRFGMSVTGKYRPALIFPGVAILWILYSLARPG